MSLKAPLVIAGGAAVVFGYAILYNGMMWLALINAAEQEQGAGAGSSLGSIVIKAAEQASVGGALSTVGAALFPGSTTPDVTPNVGPTWWQPIGFVDSLIPGRMPAGVSIGGGLGAGVGKATGKGRTSPSGTSHHGGGTHPPHPAAASTTHKGKR